MTHLYLIRHADYIYDLVDGHYPKRDQGLSPEGIIQANRLRDRLAATREIKPDVFLSSPERGARETALILEPLFGLTPLLEDGVMEWRSEDGSLTTEEFMRPWETMTDAQRPFYRWVAGCETMLEFALRVHITLNRLLTEHAGKTILVVTHGAFIQTTFAFFFGLNLAVPQHAGADIKRTSITHWYKPEGARRWALGRSNDHYHLL